MCPGGFVVAAASESGGQVVNGMSYSDRNNRYANSAIVTTVNQSDFGSNPLDGLFFQENLERKAFLASTPYHAPASFAQKFCYQTSKSGTINTSYKPGIKQMDLTTIYPKHLTTSLQAGLMKFDAKVKGFLENGILLAPETRTSSPIRISRDHDKLSSTNVSNLFPIGEGAGYAGGIISSAADGFRTGTIFQLKK